VHIQHFLVSANQLHLAGCCRRLQHFEPGALPVYAEQTTSDGNGTR
jgi:hypothetical protein